MEKTSGNFGLVADKISIKVTGRDFLIPELVKTMLKRAVGDWIERLEVLGFPCGPINDYSQVFEDPQVIHRGLKLDQLTDLVLIIASPLQFMSTPVQYQRSPPKLGSSAEAILMNLLGKSEKELQKYRQKRVI